MATNQDVLACEFLCRGEAKGKEKRERAEIVSAARPREASSGPLLPFRIHSFSRRAPTRCGPHVLGKLTNRRLKL